MIFVKTNPAFCLTMAVFACSIAMTLENLGAYHAYQSEDAFFHSGTLTVFANGEVREFYFEEAEALEKMFNQTREAMADNAPLDIHGNLFHDIEDVQGTVNTHTERIDIPADGVTVLSEFVTCTCHRSSQRPYPRRFADGLYAALDWGLQH